jgi:phosphoribosylaminoimidazolecarboxamide formyltransferase/IMP cyclohydrolase
MERLNLKYGCNPNQHDASVVCKDGPLPLGVLNGRPSYINILDALLGWQLVRDLSAVTQMKSAASFKHTSPAGAAVALPLSETERRMYFIAAHQSLSEQATAFVRARGADRLSSYGDFIALSGECDTETALLIRREVSDGVIAPSYTPKALEILKRKRNGTYLILAIDPTYEPALTEQRTLFGLTLQQERNTIRLDAEVLSPIVTENTALPAEAQLDLLVALNTLKYTQSNAVCFAKRGQAIGVGAGQQSRIHCTRLAATKADLWHLRQSDEILNLPFAEGISHNERDNVIESLLRSEKVDQQRYFDGPLPVLDQKAFLERVSGVSLASDAFFPFRDNIDRAHQSGVSYIVQAGGSVRDSDVLAAADEYAMVMITNGVRLFLH